MPKELTPSSLYAKPETELEILKSISDDPESYIAVEVNIPPKIFTVHAELARQVFDAIDNSTSIPGIDSVPSPDLLKSIEELRLSHQKVILAQVVEGMLDVLDSDKSMDEILDSYQSQLRKAMDEIYAKDASNIISIEGIWPEIEKDILARNAARKENGSACLGLPTGLTSLDNFLGGLQTGLHLVAAPPGLGKTTLTLNIGSSVAKKQVPVIFISFEEKSSRLGLKIICLNNSLESKRYLDGYGDINELNKAKCSIELILKNFYFIEGNSMLHISDITEKIKKFMVKSKQPKCLVVIDYLQAMSGTNNGYNDIRLNVSSLVGQMRQMSMNLDIPLLVISSQNRTGQGEAKLTSLKESGDLEYAADSVMFLCEDKQRSLQPPGRAVTLAIEKNRYGDRGKVNLIFRPDYGIFREEAKV